MWNHYKMFKIKNSCLFTWILWRVQMKIMSVHLAGASIFKNIEILFKWVMKDWSLSYAIVFQISRIVYIKCHLKRIRKFLSAICKCILKIYCIFKITYIDLMTNCRKIVNIRNDLKDFYVSPFLKKLQVFFNWNIYK